MILSGLRVIGKGCSEIVQAIDKGLTGMEHIYHGLIHVSRLISYSIVNVSGSLEYFTLSIADQIVWKSLVLLKCCHTMSVSMSDGSVKGHPPPGGRVLKGIGQCPLS